MLTYNVGYYFSGDEPKILKNFKDYEEAMDFYLDKQKEEFHKIGRFATALKIGYVMDGKLEGTEHIIMKNDY